MLPSTDIPFSQDQTLTVHAQALHAVISANLPFCVFKDLEVIKLMSMLCSATPSFMPTGKVIGGRLLNEAVNRWKAANKSAVNGMMANIDGKSYTLELVEVTADDKHGGTVAIQFSVIIDHIESQHWCIIIYFTTNSDGGAKKEHIIPGKERPWILVTACWAH